MPGMKRDGRCGRLWVGLLTLVQLWAVTSAAKSVYYMNNQLDCTYAGMQEMQRGETVTIIGRSPNSVYKNQCTLNFRALDTDAYLLLKYSAFAIDTCDVYLSLSGDASGGPTIHGCSGTGLPKDYFTIDRSFSIQLVRLAGDAADWNFTAKLTAVRERDFRGEDDSNPMAVGMVIGIVGAVFGVIIIVACIGICCFRKYRIRDPTKSPYIYDPDTKVKLDKTNSHGDAGFYNESARPYGSPTSKKKLLSQSDNDEKSFQNRPRNLNLKTNDRTIPPPNGRAIPPPPPAPKIPEIGKDEKQGVANGRAVNVDSGPKSSMLSALKTNKKFRESFSSTEKEAEERAKRISSSSSSFENFGNAPSPPSSNDNLSRPSLPSVQKSPKGRRQKHAIINRNPRPTSMSSDELADIERGRIRDDDPGIRVVHTDSSSPSSETVPIRVNMKQETKSKTNTTHSLRPDRSKGRGKSGKPNKSVSSATESDQPVSRGNTRTVDQESRTRDQDQTDRSKTAKDRLREENRGLNESFDSKSGSGRFNKRRGKSPRPGKSSGRGFSHRRGRSVDQLDSRPTTPVFGSMEDLESLPPLVRAGSKNSLYASRSSLYGRRRRKGSNAESLYSYRDDASSHRHSGYQSYSDDDFDGYEKPLSRKDRDRLYRSENDLGRNRKEIATQTLRETATQTGQDDSGIMQPKMLVKKKRRARSVSTSGTQTEKKKNGASKVKSKAEEKLANREKTVEKRKSKRSKSLNALDVEAENDESPKPKPKPRPRKSASSNKLLDSAKKSASVDNITDALHQPSYPQSEGFFPAGYNPHEAFPGVVHYPGPGYTGPPQYVGQPAYGMPPPNYNPNMYPGPQPGMNVVQPSSHPIPRQQKKSNWETLCEMTDGEHQYDDMTETGSVASSVFVTNPHSVPVFQPHPGAMPPPYQPQAGPKPPYLTNAYPNQQYNPPTYQSQPRVPVNFQSQENETGNQSSWEALKRMTNTENQSETRPPNEGTRHESIV